MSSAKWVLLVIAGCIAGMVAMALVVPWWFKVYERYLSWVDRMWP